MTDTDPDPDPDTETESATNTQIITLSLPDAHDLSDDELDDLLTTVETMLPDQYQALLLGSKLEYMSPDTAAAVLHQTADTIIEQAGDADTDDLDADDGFGSQGYGE